jgi:cytochrome c553
MNVVINATNGKTAGADSMGRVCVFCHTPHNATVSNGIDALPLWNHDISADHDFASYTWATPNNGAATIADALTGPSRLCMSCHDGATSVDEHGEALSQSGTKAVSATFAGGLVMGRGSLGKDLSNTHPIGFDYPAIRASRNAHSLGGTTVFNVTGTTSDTEIINESNTYAGSIENSTVAGSYNHVTKLSGGKQIVDNLYQGGGQHIMTCATCHEVHNKENVTQENYQGGFLPSTLGGAQTGQAAPNYFLYAKQQNSLICLSCHVK